VGAVLGIPIFYLVNKGVMSVSLRLRYTFRIGLLLVLITIIPLIKMTIPLLSTYSS
jgi:hypothetical protein